MTKKQQDDDRPVETFDAPPETTPTPAPEPPEPEKTVAPAEVVSLETDADGQVVPGFERCGVHPRIGQAMRKVRS